MDSLEGLPKEIQTGAGVALLWVELHPELLPGRHRLLEPVVDAPPRGVEVVVMVVERQRGQMVPEQSILTTAVGLLTVPEAALQLGLQVLKHQHLITSVTDPRHLRTVVVAVTTGVPRHLTALLQLLQEPAETILGAIPLVRVGRRILTMRQLPVLVF